MRYPGFHHPGNGDPESRRPETLIEIHHTGKRHIENHYGWRSRRPQKAYSSRVCLAHVQNRTFHPSASRVIQGAQSFQSIQNIVGASQ